MVIKSRRIKYAICELVIFVEIEYATEINGKWSVGAKAIVSVHIKDGNSHTGT